MKSQSTPLIQDAEIPLSPAELEVCKGNLYKTDQEDCKTQNNFATINRYFDDNILKKVNM